MVDIKELVGYTGHIGREDVKFGKGDETFSVPTSTGGTVNLTKIPSPDADTYSKIKNRLYAQTGIGDAGAAGVTGSLAYILNTESGVDAIIEFPSGEYAIATNVSIPSNFTLRFQKGAYFSGTGNITMDNAGQIMGDPDWQIFTGSGTITFTNGGRVLADWFATVNAAAASGADIVELMDRTYTDADITLSSGQKIKGRSGSILKASGVSSLYFVSLASNSSIEDVEIDINTDGCMGVRASSCDVVSARNVYVHNFDLSTNNRSGFYFSGCTKFEISGCRVIEATWPGIYVNSSSEGQIRGNISNKNATTCDDKATQSGDGIYVRDSSHVVITGNICQENNRIGITLEENTGTCTEIIVSNNLCKNNSKTAQFTGGGDGEIHAECSGRYIIEGNICDSSGLAADAAGRKILWSANDTTWCSIANNLIVGSTTRNYVDTAIGSYGKDKISENVISETFFGIGGQGVSQYGDIIISDNVFKNLDGPGIYSDADDGGPYDVENLQVVGNYFIDCGQDTASPSDYSAGIRMRSDITWTNCLIANNVFIDENGNMQYGIHSDGDLKDTTVSGNRFEDIQTIAIQLIGDDIEGCSVCNNLVRGGSGGGVRIKRGYDAQICGNVILDTENATYQMIINGGRNSQVCGNIICPDTTYTAAAGGNGIYIACDEDVEAFNISGNQISYCDGVGILIVPGSGALTFENSIISQNIVTDCSGAGIDNNDNRGIDYCVVTGNIVRGNGATSALNALANSFGANSEIANNINP